jgi:hypothetical protein
MKTNEHAQATTRAQSIRIMGFVDGDVIPPACYDKPYCLEPDKQDGKAYEVLREVMHRTRKVGLASVVIEKKQALAAIIPIGRTLVLNVLRLATSLVPGKRSDPAVAPQALPKPQATSAGARRRAGQSHLVEVPKQAARIAPSRKQGEVIDLAVRRSSKRAAQGRTAKTPRTRGGNVATLHQLRRKSASARTPEIQLA